MTQLYYDNFANEVVTEIDDIAPPERYIKVHCGTDVFIEKWSVGNGRYLDIAYTQKERELGLVYGIRKNMQERYNVSLSYIAEWTVTKEHYEKMKGGEEE